MAYPYTNHKWTQNTAFAVGDVVRANPGKLNTLAFKCITAGTSDSASEYSEFEYPEPAFPFKIGQTLVDGTVTWEAFEPLAEELLRLEPTAVIDLFEVHLTQEINGADLVFRYHAGLNGISETIKFDTFPKGHPQEGQEIEYPAVPVEVDGFEFTSKGTLPRPTLRVANVNDAISNLLLSYKLLGAKVQRIRTFVKFINPSNFNQQVQFTKEADVEGLLTTQNNDPLIMETFNDSADPQAKMVETWYVDRIASENLQFVEFELAPKIDLTNLQLPRRTIEDACPWRYRGEKEGTGPGCTYVGDRCFTAADDALPDRDFTNDVCGKRLSSCRLRFPGEKRLPFGGFIGARLQA